MSASGSKHVESNYTYFTSILLERFQQAQGILYHQKKEKKQVIGNVVYERLGRRSVRKE